MIRHAYGTTKIGNKRCGLQVSKLRDGAFAYVEWRGKTYGAFGPFLHRRSHWIVLRIVLVAVIANAIGTCLDLLGMYDVGSGPK